MALRLKGSSSGYAEIDASADAGSVTLTLPATAGTINVKDASGNTNVGTGVNLGNPGPNIFTINTNGSERLRIAADGGVSIPGVLTYEDVTSVDAIGLSTFRDGLNTKDVGITTITSSDINGATAVDVFVYDTSKDSDGGAWRKRTQHTSWYNETLGTATRGSRREFPAVAVIVAEADKVTIYDGDDPDLPLWMVFNVSNSTWFKLHSSGPQCSCISALNATLCAGGNGAGIRLAVVDFIKDNQYLTEAGYTYYQTNGIVTRNDTTTFANDGGSKSIVNNIINDVAMTVLPNAPIDDTTGLPVPTIAVGTDGGVSVITDDGTVVDMYVSGESDQCLMVNFTDSNDLAVRIHNGWLPYYSIPSADVTSTYWNGVSGYKGRWTDTTRDWGTGTNGIPVNVGANGITELLEDKAIGHTNGLEILQTDLSSFGNGMHAGIATNFNTGWMQGDIKGAFLSDTDTTNVTSSNLISGATYSNSDRITSYSYTNGSSTLVITDNPATADGYVTLTLGGLTPSTTYVLSLTANQTYTPTAGYNIHVGGTVDGTVYFDDDFTGTGNQSITFKTASSGDPTLVLYSNYNGALTYTLNLRLAEFDRSVGSISAWNAGQTTRIGQKNGLAVYGTVTKSAVATGAELVAYSGWSSSNYLEQPYNSSLGLSSTDSVTIICWIKQASNNNSIEVIFGTGQMTTGQGRYIYTNSGRPYLDTYGGAANNSTTVITDNIWHHLVAIYTPSGGFMYIDGTLDATPTYGSSGYASQSGSPQLGTRIGCERSGALPTPAYVSLLRISNSVPSAEQVKKMYEDEKVLFQENAKATLYGSSDAVTALAYDEVTDQLHVGTSSGRSDFQGLRRINNTTTAVTTAISAHDTFIIEQ